jgi:hypothetical protein
VHPQFAKDISPRDKNAYNALHILESFAPTAAIRNFLYKQKDQVRAKIVGKLKRKAKGKAIKIDRVKKISPEAFRKKYMEPGIPVIFEGAAKDWGCCREWSLDFFARKYGREHALLVEAEGLTGHNVKGDYDLLDVQDVMDNIKKKGDKYLRFSPLIDNHQELRDQLNMDWLNKMRNPWSPANGFQLFIGGAGTRTKLHCAMQCNFFVMVSGEKRWRLLPTKYNAIINPPASRALYNHSQVDVYDPDLEAFPGFDKIDYYDVHLKPGDVFYNPPFMWHDVSNLTDTIGVAYRFGFFRGAIKGSSTLTFMRMTANNPPVWKSLWYTMKDINLIYASTNGNFKEVYEKLNSRQKKV